MAVNQAKSKPSELAPTPEENVVEGGKVDDTLTRTISRTRSGVSLQERLLVCGNMTALLDAEARMGRRPSTTSLGPESTAKERGGDEDLGYFTLKRVCAYLQVNINQDSRLVKGVCWDFDATLLFHIGGCIAWG